MPSDGDAHRMCTTFGFVSLKAVRNFIKSTYPESSMAKQFDGQSNIGIRYCSTRIMRWNYGKKINHKIEKISLEWALSFRWICFSIYVHVIFKSCPELRQYSKSIYLHLRSSVRIKWNRHNNKSVDIHAHKEQFRLCVNHIMCRYLIHFCVPFDFYRYLSWSTSIDCINQNESVVIQSSTEVSSFVAVTRELCVLLTSSDERNENETRARSWSIHKMVLHLWLELLSVFRWIFKRSNQA